MAQVIHKLLLEGYNSMEQAASILLAFFSFSYGPYTVLNCTISLTAFVVLVREEQ